MNYLYVAIIEDSNECLVSFTDEDLREQVTHSLAKRSIVPFTDAEWADCVKGEYNREKTIDCLPFGVIYYYKTESKLEEMIVGISNFPSKGILESAS